MSGEGFADEVEATPVKRGPRNFYGLTNPDHCDMGRLGRFGWTLGRNC
jgi:hypothetical protein